MLRLSFLNISYIVLYPQSTNIYAKFSSSNGEVPRVFTIYDIGLTVPAARQAVRN